MKRTAERSGLPEVAEDEAYLSRWTTETAERFGGSPCIPSETGAVFPKNDPIWDNMYYTFMCSWQLSSECYRKRSDVEWVFSIVKGKFRDSVRPRSDEGQVNEVLARVLCHNICVLIKAAHDLGIGPTFGAGSGVEPKLFI